MKLPPAPKSFGTAADAADDSTKAVVVKQPVEPSRTICLYHRALGPVDIFADTIRYGPNTPRNFNAPVGTTSISAYAPGMRCRIATRLDQIDAVSIDDSIASPHTINAYRILLEQVFEIQGSEPFTK